MSIFVRLFKILFIFIYIVSSIYYICTFSALLCEYNLKRIRRFQFSICWLFESIVSLKKKLNLNSVCGNCWHYQQFFDIGPCFQCFATVQRPLSNRFLSELLFSFNKKTMNGGYKVEVTLIHNFFILFFSRDV